MTLGQTATAFLETYPERAADEAYSFGSEAAVSFRNRLVHHFLEGAIDAFRTDTGIKLLTLECILMTEHIRELERVVWANYHGIIEPFFHQPEESAQAYIDGHPLREHLRQIEAGVAPENRGLDWWGPIESGDRDPELDEPRGTSVDQN